IAGPPGGYLGDDNKRIYVHNHEINTVEKPNHSTVSPSIAPIRSQMIDLYKTWYTYESWAFNWNKVRNLVIDLLIMLDEAREVPEPTRFNNLGLPELFETLIRDLEYLPKIPTRSIGAFAQTEFQLYTELKKKRDSCDKWFKRVEMAKTVCTVIIIAPFIPPLAACCCIEAFFSSIGGF
ncbi:hypothetical protein FRC02_006735, partial [Tulasnella sp. 418]